MGADTNPSILARIGRSISHAWREVWTSYVRNLERSGRLPPI
jgi:hypothetical protein